jgi:hypothetical protein
MLPYATATSTGDKPQFPITRFLLKELKHRPRVDARIPFLLCQNEIPGTRESQLGYTPNDTVHRPRQQRDGEF